MDKAFIENCYKQSIRIAENTNEDQLSQALVNATILYEYSVKLALKKANPLAPYSLDNLTNNPNDVAAIIKGERPSIRTKHEDLGILIDRLRAIGSENNRSLLLIQELASYRNAIVHDPHVEYDKIDAHSLILDLLIGTDNLLEKYLDLKPTSTQLESLQETAYIVERLVADKLENRIKHARELSKIPEDVREQLSEDPFWYGDEGDIVYDGIRCPACGKLTMSQRLFYDVDWNPDGVIELARDWLFCSNCSLNMTTRELEDVNENPKQLAGFKKADKSWGDFLKIEYMVRDA